LKRLRSQEPDDLDESKLAEQEELLMTLRDEGDLHHFGGPDELHLDVTDLLPEEAADRIMAHVRERCGGFQ